MTPKILIFTTNWGPFCRRAKALFTEKGVKWTEHDIEDDPAQRQAMEEATGRSTVPQIFINGKHIGGSDDLLELDAKGELDKLLAGEVSAT
jgi:glutaredoxin 3